MSSTGSRTINEEYIDERNQEIQVDMKYHGSTETETKL